MAGYLSREYAQSLAEFGKARHLPNSQGWILERPVPGFNLHDAMGCYPLFSCHDWARLKIDLADMSDLVCLSLVTDPFGNYMPTTLQECFTDVFFPFKEHFIVDLKLPIGNSISKHHRRNAKNALKVLDVERCADPAQYVNEWADLYSVLVERHGIKGLTAFSKCSFAKQLSVPGLMLFRAMHQGLTVGMTLWYVQQDKGYYHLGAYSALGYELRASFALFWVAIEHLAASGLRWLSLGAGAGVKGDSAEGLTRFKSGWSTQTRPVYFCGKVFDPNKYQEIRLAKGALVDSYFPAYRSGEFG